MDRKLAALADPTRRAMLARLAQGEATVAQIAAPFGISQPAVSRHLKVLEQAGLIEARVAGTARPRRLRPEGVADLVAWFGPYLATLDARFRALDVVLAAAPDDENFERTER